MKFLNALLLICIFSCAKPNYRPVQPITENQKQDLVDGKRCPLFFQTEHLCFEYKWINRPTQDEMGKIEFKFYVQEKPEVSVIPNHKVDVVLWMPAMGHGSRPVTVEQNPNSTYTASKVFFIMPGEWEIRFQLKEDKNVYDQIVEKIKI